MSWTENKPIKFKLGLVAIWNLLTRRVVRGNDPTLTLLQKFCPDIFEDLTKAPK